MVNPSVEMLHAKHSRSGQAIYLTVVVAVLLAFASLPFIEVDVNTRSRGMVRSDLENNALLIPASGQVQQVFLANNQSVQLGDTLLVLNSAALDEQIRFTEERLQEINRHLKDFQQLLTVPLDQQPVLKTLIGQREYNQYQQKRAEYDLRIQYARQHEQRQAQLLESGSIARVEYEQAVYDLELAQNGLSLLTEQHQRNWALERDRYHTEFQQVSSEAQRLQESRKQYVLTASMEGSITQFSGIQVGNFVSAGQVVAQISAHNDLLVEAYVPPSDIGLIKEGMPVQFQVDAFHSNQWGLATGQVTEISKDVVVAQDQPVFLVKCEMEDSYLALKNGYRGTIKKGMTLTAHFSVTKRSLSDLLYDKIDDWLDPSEQS